MTSTFLAALQRQACAHTPIWMMRQAGRYLPEYRALREKAGSFLNLCRNPDYACEITLQPLRRCPFDAAILFADILLIADAMGCGLEMVESKGPVFTRPVQTQKDIQNLPNIEPLEALPYLYETIKRLKAELKTTPLIGFAGSPWTVAAYMVDGRGTKDFYALRQLQYRAPESLHQLLTHLSDNTARYLIEQIRAGADAIMLFDTWGGLLPSQHYSVFSLNYIQKIVTQIKAIYPNTPIILYSKNGMSSLDERAHCGVDALGLDWTCDLRAAKLATQGKVALQGNLDPTVLYADKSTIKKEAESLLRAYGSDPGYIFNLGHGVPLDVPPDHVAFLVDTVHHYQFR